MAPDQGVDDLVGLVADERLLSVDPALLPAAIGRPRPIPESAARGRLVGAGVTMTTVDAARRQRRWRCSARSTCCLRAAGVLGVIALVLGLLLAGHPLGVGARRRGLRRLA